MEICGYSGVSLWVDLNRRSFERVETERDLIENYIGGRGFTSAITFHEVERFCNPLGPDNVLVFAVGPLTGIAPCSSRFEVGGKSPLTGLIGWSSSGSSWAIALRRAGYDCLILKGRSEDPAVLVITDEEVSLVDGSPVWGKDTVETDYCLRHEYSMEDYEIISIGPAGERLVPIAAIMDARGHAAARCGLGAVMGSKNLKAIAVKGTKRFPRIYNSEAFEKIEKSLRDHFKSDGSSSTTARLYGTPAFTVYANDVYGGLGTRNFQTGWFEKVEMISGERLRRLYGKNTSCYGCPIGCDRISTVSHGEFSGTTCYSGPEYATIQNQGSRLGNSNLESIIKANELANRFGLDTYSLGGVLGFAFELFEKGIISRSDSDGLELIWGNYRAQLELELIRKIAYKEGFGQLLAYGSKKAAEVIGKGSIYYSINIKGMEYPSTDPRGSKEYGLGCSVSTRGADHLFALGWSAYFTRELAGELFGNEEAANPHSPSGKGKMVAWFEEGMTICDVMGVCKLAYETWNDDASAIIFRRLWAIPEMFRAVTGMAISNDEILERVHRLTTLEKLFNIREMGVGRAEDSVPERFLKEPMPSGPAKGNLFERDVMLDEYYEVKCWDKATGWPTRKTLTRLGLDGLVKENFWPQFLDAPPSEGRNGL